MQATMQFFHLMVELHGDCSSGPSRGGSVTDPKAPSAASVEQLHRRRNPRTLRERFHKLLRPPDPFVMNPREAMDAPLGRWNLYIGGGGCHTPGYVNIDLFALPGVDVAADAERLPFAAGVF